MIFCTSIRQFLSRFSWSWFWWFRRFWFHRRNDFFINMNCVAIWKFLSFYEAVAWNIFLRLFAIFTWITWNLVSFFILEWCLNFFVDVLDVAIWKFLSLYEAVTWDIFLRLCSILFRYNWCIILIYSNWISSFIYKCCNWANCWCVSFFNFCSVRLFYLNCNSSSFSREVFLPLRLSWFLFSFTISSALIDFKIAVSELISWLFVNCSGLKKS